MTDLGTHRRFEDALPDAAAAGEISTWQPLYERISLLLQDNRLEPTPTNYALAHRYFTAADATFNSLVDKAIAGGGLNGANAAAIIAQRSIELSAADLQIIVTEAQARLAEMVDLVESSGRDTRAYGEALESNHAELVAGAAPQTVVESLIGLTTKMVSRTQTVEEQLQTACSEIRQLRDNLAEAQDAANRDALTGLPNRRALDSRLAFASDLARRTGEPFSIAICDIDNFKLFNDRFGHQIGDEVIKFVATSLAGSASDRLFAARYGGEEFVVLFEGMDRRTAAAEVDRIRSAIAARDLHINATGQMLGRLTFSAGVAQLETEDGGTSPMLKRADTALYEAKKAGRNQVLLG